MDLEKRIRMAAESILENESLREGLDDEAASALIDWGIARAQQIAAKTADLEDDIEAEETIYPHMRGLRRILRAVAELYSGSVEPVRRSELLEEISGQLSAVYGPDAPPLRTFSLSFFLATQKGSTAERINAFRTLIEGNTSKPM